MGHRGFLSRVVGRALIGLGLLVVLTLVVRLVMAVLKPLLPSWMFSLAGMGGGVLYQMFAPALPPAAALLLIGVGWWLLSGRR